MNLSDPPEKVSLQITSEGPVVEGDNVTLKCLADGNPLPTSFFFHFKVSQILQELKRSKFNVHGGYRCIAFEQDVFRIPRCDGR